MQENYFTTEKAPKFEVIFFKVILLLDKNNLTFSLSGTNSSSHLKSQPVKKGKMCVCAYIAKREGGERGQQPTNNYCFFMYGI